MTSPRGDLRLALADPAGGDPTDSLTLSLPQKDSSQPKKAEALRLRLCLINDTDRIARYIQVDVEVEAPFLAYPYNRSPLTIVEAGEKWRVEKASTTKFNCSFDGGANVVCHKHARRDLGMMVFLVPCGEADGGPVTLSIRYEVTAEEHAGSGVLTVGLQSASR